MIATGQDSKNNIATVRKISKYFLIVGEKYILYRFKEKHFHIVIRFKRTLTGYLLLADVTFNFGNALMH